MPNKSLANIILIALFQIFAVSFDLINIAHGNTSFRQLSPLAITLCDGYQAWLEKKRSSFISVDTFISAILGLVAFLFPNLKDIANKLHTIQIWKYAGYAIRSHPNFGDRVEAETNFYKRFLKESLFLENMSLKFIKNVFLIHLWFPKFLQNPILFFAENSRNFFIIKAWGEFGAGFIIISTELYILIQKYAFHNYLINNQYIMASQDFAWWIIKILYFINAIAWFSRSLQIGRSGEIRLSEAGLGFAKALHAVFANIPSLAFASRALERFFYMITSAYKDRISK